MEFAPNYEEAHLFVAAVRVFAHQQGHSPTPEDVARFLELSTEKAFILVHELKKLGVLRVLESPFELRLDPGDPTPLESLPRGESPSRFEGELNEFQSREQEKKKEMERMFRGGEAERRRRERVEKLEAEFMKFKPKPGALDSLFKPKERAKSAEDDGEE